MRRRLALAIPLLLAFTLAGGLGWLLGSTAGLQTTLAAAQRLSDERLQLTEIDGRLSGPMHIGRLQWRGDTQQLVIEGVDVEWSPLALLHGELRIARLRLGTLTLQRAAGADTEPSTLPSSLALPLTVEVDALQIGSVRMNGTLLADRIEAALRSRGGTHMLSRLTLRRGAQTLSAHGRIAAAAPFALALDADWQGRLASGEKAQDYALKLRMRGTLARIEAQLAASGVTQAAQGTQKPPPANAMSLHAQATLQPFEGPSIAALSVEANAFDLAALWPTLPHTRLDAQCALAPSGTSADAAPNCRLDNAAAGPLDRERLPLRRLRARLQGDADGVRLAALRLDLGGGQLSGEAAWSAAGADVQLTARNLDLASLHGALRPTQLAGPLHLRDDAQGRQLALNLHQPDLALRARASQAGDTLRVESLQLDSGAAQLGLSGTLRLPAQGFELSGSFARFDPARWLRVPAGTLNGDFRASGALQPTLQAKASLRLHDSRFAGALAQGRAEIDLRWPQLQHAEIALDLGRNHLRVQGGYGAPGQTLRLAIDAPALAPYGADGELYAQLQLGGSRSAPYLRGRVDSAHLRLPGYARIEGLHLDADLGAADNAPFRLVARLQQLDLPTRSAAVGQLQLDVAGTRRAQRWRLDTRLDGERSLTLAASGGFGGDKRTAGADAWQAWAWHGQLDELRVDSAEAGVDGGTTLLARLLAPAPLQLGATRWQLGPLRLQTPQAALRMTADADGRRVRIDADAGNADLGTIALELQARAAAWALSAQMPWQGRLRADIRDLGWFDPLLGGNWQAGGRLQADVAIAGTPQFPQLSGTIAGAALALRQLDTAMQLRDGRLRARLHDGVLDLDDFAIDSVLATPPPALQQLLGARARTLTASPGRIGARGRMTLGSAAGVAQALSLDLTLDRVGVAQTPRQWLLLSGQGRLSWQARKFGVDAQLTVDAAHWQLADLARPQLSNDVVVHRDGSGSDNAAPRRLTPWTGRVRVGLGRYFSFAGAGARGRLAGQVDISAGAHDLPRASGSVHLVDGRYDAYGQQLEIERGILNFQGLLENPALNIRALRRGLPVEAGVEIGGFAQAPVVRLVSEPNVPDAEKLSWLVLGRPPEQDGADAGVLMAAVGAIFGNDMNSAGQGVKQAFGIDDINLRSGTLDQQQAMNSSIVPLGGTTQTGGQVLSVGKQLSDRLRLSYEQALGGTGSLVKLTLQLSKRLSVVGTSGSDAALDVFYSFAFGRNAPPRKPPDLGGGAD